MLVLGTGTTKGCIHSGKRYLLEKKTYAYTGAVQEWHAWSDGQVVEMCLCAETSEQLAAATPLRLHRPPVPACSRDFRPAGLHTEFKAVFGC